MHRNGEAINASLPFVLELCHEELVRAAQQHKRGHSQIYFIYLEQGGLGVEGGARGKRAIPPWDWVQRQGTYVLLRASVCVLNACSLVQSDLCASSVSLF